MSSAYGQIRIYTARLIVNQPRFTASLVVLNQ